jgi:dTDP-4-amino-4,6-dideoxygalactose transaminase
MTMNVPLVDLRAAHAGVATQVEEGFARVLSTGAFVQGPDVAAFEAEYSSFIGVRHCVGVANGTDALEIALRAAGLNAGDDVVIPANTFFATAEAVLRAGGRPVSADVRPDDLLLDVNAVEAAVTERTRFLMPVHLYGQSPDMKALIQLAERHDLQIVEDAAQSQGAMHDGRALGSWGLAAGTSFYPGKNLGAYGDAGAVLTDDDDVAALARLISNHGSSRRYHHEVVGTNSRLDTLQAVVLRAKLARLATDNESRRAAAARYLHMLEEMEEVTVPVAVQPEGHVWHLFVIQVDERDRVLSELNAAGVGAAVHYPVPIHLHPAMAHLGGRPGDFPVTEAAAGRILSLPLYPQITEEQQDYVVTALKAALGRN